MTDYDFTDPAIRDMVAKHRPVEMWSPNTGLLLRGPYCEECGDDWVCAPAHALRGWEKHRTRWMHDE